MVYNKEEKYTYFQIQPYSEKSKKYNLKTKLKMELVNFNMEKIQLEWCGTQMSHCRLLF